MAQMDILTTRKEAKSLPPDTFMGPKTIKIVYAAGTPARTQPGELTALPRPRAGKGRVAEIAVGPLQLLPLNPRMSGNSRYRGLVEAAQF